MLGSPRYSGNRSLGQEPMPFRDTLPRSWGPCGTNPLTLAELCGALGPSPTGFADLGDHHVDRQRLRRGGRPGVLRGMTTSSDGSSPNRKEKLCLGSGGWPARRCAMSIESTWDVSEGMVYGDATDQWVIGTISSVGLDVKGIGRFGLPIRIDLAKPLRESPRRPRSGAGASRYDEVVAHESIEDNPANRLAKPLCRRGLDMLG